MTTDIFTGTGNLKAEKKKCASNLPHKLKVRSKDPEITPTQRYTIHSYNHITQTMGNAPSKDQGQSRGCCGFGEEEGPKANIKDFESNENSTPWKISEHEALRDQVRESQNQSPQFQISSDIPNALQEQINEESLQRESQQMMSDSNSDNDMDEAANSYEENTGTVDSDGDMNMMTEKGDAIDLECNEEEVENSAVVYVSSPSVAERPIHHEPRHVTLMGHANWVEALATNGTLICSAGVDEDIKVWDARTGNVIMTLSGHDDVITSVTISHDGQHICSGSVDKTVRIWDAKKGKQLASMYGHTEAVMEVAYSDDDVYIVSGSIDGTMRLWNVYDAGDGGVYQCVKVFRGHSKAVDSVAYSPNGNCIVSGGEDATLRIWNPKTGECTNIIRGHTGWFYCVAYAPKTSPNTNFICTGSHIGNVIDIWNGTTRKLHKTMKGHTGPVLSVAYSPDGKYIASGSADHTVRLWEVETGTCIAVLEGHTNIAGAIAFGSDGKNTIIVSGSRDHEVRMWYVFELAPRYFQ